MTTTNQVNLFKGLVKNKEFPPKCTHKPKMINQNAKMKVDRFKGKCHDLNKLV